MRHRRQLTNFDFDGTHSSPGSPHKRMVNNRVGTDRWMNGSFCSSEAHTLPAVDCDILSTDDCGNVSWSWWPKRLGGFAVGEQSGYDYHVSRYRGTSLQSQVPHDSCTGTCRQFRYPQGIAKAGTCPPILGGMALVWPEIQVPTLQPYRVPR